MWSNAVPPSAMNLTRPVRWRFQAKCRCLKRSQSGILFDIARNLPHVTSSSCSHALMAGAARHIVSPLSLDNPMSQDLIGMACFQQSGMSRPRAMASNTIGDRVVIHALRRLAFAFNDLAFFKSLQNFENFGPKTTSLSGRSFRTS